MVSCILFSAEPPKTFRLAANGKMLPVEQEEHGIISPEIPISRL